METIALMPEWFQGLEKEDIAFIRNFVLASGSLKEIAKLYKVTYPTVRPRLARVIQTIKLHEQTEGDPFVLRIKQLAIDDRIDMDTAKLLVQEYRNTVKEG